MHLEHHGDSSICDGREWWMVSVVGTRVSLGFTHPLKTNGTDDLMPRLVVSKLLFDAPMNWDRLILASSEITMMNPNRMWSLKNEIGYFMPQHDHPIEFFTSSIALMSFDLWPLEDQPWNTLRAPWRLLDMGWPRMMDGLHGWKQSVTRLHPPISS